jgi:hypothetical protein
MLLDDLASSGLSTSEAGGLPIVAQPASASAAASSTEPTAMPGAMRQLSDAAWVNRVMGRER